MLNTIIDNLWRQYKAQAQEDFPEDSLQSQMNTASEWTIEDLNRRVYDIHEKRWGEHTEEVNHWYDRNMQ